MTSSSKFDGVEGKVDLCSDGGGPGVTHWVVSQSLDGPGETASLLQDRADPLGGDELLPLVSPAGYEAQDVLRPHDHHQPAEGRVHLILI